MDLVKIRKKDVENRNDFMYNIMEMNIGLDLKTKRKKGWDID